MNSNKIKDFSCSDRSVLTTNVIMTAIHLPSLHEYTLTTTCASTPLRKALFVASPQYGAFMASQKPFYARVPLGI